jgi:putative ABC transport system permease protein
VRALLSVEAWADALAVLRAWPLRTLLTGGSVAWGVFMLVMLLAAGKGLENNLRWSYRDDAVNSVWIWPSTTSRPWKGLPPRRPVLLNDDDTALIQALPEAGAVTARFFPPAVPIARGSRVGNFEIRATHPDHQVLEGTILRSGRFLNDRDVEQRRKVAVIGRRVAQFFFPGEDVWAAPLGAELRAGGVAFTVVGVFADEGGEREEQLIYIPVTTGQAAFGGRDRVDMLLFTIGSPEVDGNSLEAADRAVDAVRRGLAAHHRFDPADPRALRVRDEIHTFAGAAQVFQWLRAFTWAVGVGTLLAAMVGVGNILLISLKERMPELGLRRALGARPADLVVMVLQEALLLTVGAGWAGLLIALGALELLRRHLPENDYLRDPDVELSTVLGALLALVLAGIGAALLPALVAVRTTPVDALRGGP